MRADCGLLRLIADLSIGGAALASLGGCALQRYEPAPLDPAASASAFESRSVDASGLKEYMLAHGHPASEWPVQRWGLADLTLLAFYYQPNLELARAQAAAARAQVAAATQRAPIAIKPAVLHHSLTAAGHYGALDARVRSRDSAEWKRAACRPQRAVRLLRAIGGARCGFGSVDGTLRGSGTPARLLRGRSHARTAGGRGA